MKFDEVAEFHGHVCPGLALGFRVASFALKKLQEIRSEDEEIVAIVENNSCAVDAVQAMTGCTFGKGNFIFFDYGKQVYTFLKRPSGEGIRISVKWTPPEEDGETAEAWRRYVQGDRPPEVLAKVAERKKQKVEQIFRAEDDELFAVSNPVHGLPQKAQIHPSYTCRKCGEKVMAPKLKEGLCLPCQNDD